MIASALTRIRARFHPLHQLRKHRWFRIIAGRLDLPISVRLRYVDVPVRIRLVRNATYWLTPGSPEPEIVSLFIAIQRVIEPDVFWDVGANIGIYGWLLKSLDHLVHVIMLEPDPVNCELLKETRRRTSWLGDVDIRQAAASSHGGVVEFALDPISSATGSIVSDRRTFSEDQYGVIPATIQTASLALDELGGPRPPKLIKIDTEGHESEVIAGARATLQTHSPVLIVECFDQGSPALITLRALGYTLLDAERPDLAWKQGCSSDTTNFLAMPARLLEKLPTLMAVWRETLAQVRPATSSRRDR